MSAFGGKADMRFRQIPDFDSPLTARSGRFLAGPIEELTHQAPLVRFAFVVND